MNRIDRRGPAAIMGALALAAVLSATGCSAKPSRDSAESSGAAPAAAGLDQKGGPGQQVAPGAANKPGQQDTTANKADLRVDQRTIIYTGSITVRVDNVDEAGSRAATIATTAGGFVGGDERTSNTSSSRAKLVLRVPAARFAAVVDELATLGRQERRNIETQDVTEETLDLDARLATQRARVESGRRLLSQAKSLSDLVMLESELAKREADLAALEAKKRRLADLTALSTIDVTLLGPKAEQEDDEPDTGFLAGVKGGWAALVASAGVLLTVLGALLPWLVVLGVPVVGIIWLARRGQRRRRAGVTVPPLTPPTPAAPTSKD